MAREVDTLWVEDEAPTIYVDTIFLPRARRNQHSSTLEVFTHGLIGALATSLVGDRHQKTKLEPMVRGGLAAHRVHSATPRVRPRILMVAPSSTDRDSMRHHFSYTSEVFDANAIWQRPITVASGLQSGIRQLRTDVLVGKEPRRWGRRDTVAERIGRVISPIMHSEQYHGHPSSYRLAQMVVEVGNAILEHERIVLGLERGEMPSLEFSGLELTREPDATTPVARPCAPAL